MGQLSDLYNIVEDVYGRERDRSSSHHRESDDWTRKDVISIHDLSEQGCAKYLEEQKQLKKSKKRRNDVTQLELYELWYNLMEVLMTKEVFTDHVQTLAKGFKVCVVDSRGASLIEQENYVHAETLLHLLVHTAENAHVDDSTECRFVTLLEVLLSYAPGWDPSDDVSKLWIRLMQRIPNQCPPINFRRKAYRVLVSLSWVPSSSLNIYSSRSRRRIGGLLAACSIEERKVNITALPKASRTYRSAAKDDDIVVPRHDAVNQLLDRLKDETDVCVAITSKINGMGKGTLASVVVSHPSIQKSFFVVWLKLSTNSPSDQQESANKSRNPMSFATYCRYITQLCDQIREQQYLKYGQGQDKVLDITFDPCEPRFEEPSVRELRELKAIQDTQRKVAAALNSLSNPKLLLVLENVTSDAQIPLFRFHDQQSLVVTTTEVNLKNVDWQVSVEPMSSQEAMDLFLGQAGLPLNHPLGWTPELQALLSKDCQSHPLVIRSVARWCRLKAVCAGPIRACIEILNEVRALTLDYGSASGNRKDSAYLDGSFNNSTNGDARNTNGINEITNGAEVSRFLYDILSFTMGPQRVDGAGTSAVFVVCLAAMAVVFPGRVPLDVVLLLWEQILLVEPLTAGEVQDLNGEDYQGEDNSIQLRRRYVGMVAEGLLHMGVIEIYEAEDDVNGGGGTWIEIHHEMYAHFALAMAEELDLGDSFEHTVQEWHKAFVTSYFAQRIQGDRIDAGGKNSLDYAVRSLPMHIFQANMTRMAETMLTDAKFFETRVDSLGWEKAVEIQISDCMQLQSGLDDEEVVDENSADGMSDQPAIATSPVFSKTAAIFTSYANRDRGDDEAAADAAFERVSRALYRMAFSLAEHGHLEESLTQFKAAHEFSPESIQLDASIEFGRAWVLLITGDSKKALSCINESLDLMDEIEKDHVLYKEAKQLLIDVLYERCDYSKALKITEETERELLDDVRDDNYIELGAVLKKKGFVLQIMGQPRKAVEAYKKAIEWKGKADEYSYGLASCFCQLGDVNMELKALSAAKESFDQAIAMLTKVDCDPEHVQYLLSVAKSRFLKSDFAGCFASLHAAREAISSTPLHLMDQSAYDLRCIAQTYQARGNLEDAIRVLQEALTLTKHRPRSLERAACLSDIGRCLLDRKREKEGLDCLEESLTIKIETLGQNIELLEMMHTIGKVHRLRGEYDESLATYARAERLLKSVAPDDTAKGALVHFAVGEVFEAKGDPLESLASYKRGVDLLQKTHASDDVMIGKGNQYMGRALATSNRLEEARKKFAEAVRIRTRNFDPIGLSESQFDLGVVLRKMGKHTASEKALLESLNIRRKDAGSHEHLETLFEMGNNYRLSGDHDTAFALYEDCANKVDRDDPLGADIYQAMGNVMLFKMKFDEAVVYYLRAQDTRQTHFGQNHRKTAHCATSVGLTNLLSGNHAAALTTLDSVFAVYASLAATPTNATKNGAKQDHTLAAIFLGDAYWMNNRTREASDFWNKAKTICQEAERGVGIDIHPSVKRMFERRLQALAQGRPVCFDVEEGRTIEAVVFVDD